MGEMSKSTVEPKLERLKFGTLRASTYEVLYDAIVTGRFASGDAIREVPIAQELGVSQNTVREALMKLEAQGLVVRTPNKHTTVTSLTPAAIWERVSLRMILEPYVSIRAARHMTPEHFTMLHQKLQRLTKAVEENQWMEMGQADLDFHRCIWEKSGNQLVYNILDQASVQLFAFVTMVRNRQKVDRHRVVVNPHEDLYAALQSKEPARIFASFRAHLVGSYEDFLPEDWDGIEALAFSGNACRHRHSAISPAK